MQTLLPNIAIRPGGLPVRGDTGAFVSSMKADGPARAGGPEKTYGPAIDFTHETALEIGFGGGEHLAWQAAQNPNTQFIGAEPFINGVAKLLTQIEAQDLHNIRILHGDVRPFLDSLPTNCLSRVFILHPDPWPKKRHYKRRIVNGPVLQALARTMKPGTELRIASDMPDYIRWVFLQLRLYHKAAGRRVFSWIAGGPADWQTRPADWPQTRYEIKALKAGRAPTYLRFKRQS